MRRHLLRPALLLLPTACTPSAGSPPPPPAPAAVAAVAAPGELYRLETYSARFREDQAQEVPVGVPRQRAHPVASVDLGPLTAGDVLLVTAAYTIASQLDSTNTGIATTISLADHPGDYQEGDRDILGFSSHNLANRGEIFPHYSTPSFTTIYRVLPGDERFRYVNLVAWIGTDDRRQEGKTVRLTRAQLDVLRFARAGTAHASR
jgi:hypothetical protein